MKRVLFLFYLLCFSCDVYYNKLPSDAELVILESFEAYRQSILAEQENLPDFNCVEVEVDLKVPSLPGAKWFSVDAPCFGSSLAKTGGELFYRIQDIPATFRTCGPNTDAVSRLLFATQMPLLDTSPQDRKFIPCAARAWAFAEDQKTVYYKLNENMRWSDGSPCTADDFVFALKFFTSKNLIDPWVNDSFEDISVEKLDTFLIAVSYEHGEYLSPTELLSITNLRPVSEKFYNGIIPENWAEEYNLRPEPTTGPYHLTNYDLNKGLTFTKVENWWGHEYKHYQGIANFDKITYAVYVGKEKEGLKHFKAGKFDLLELENSGSFISSLDEDCVNDGYVTPWRTTINPLVGMYGFFFNTADPMLSDINVRQAVFCALDIEGLGNLIYSANYVRLTTLGANQTFDGVNFNNEEIRPTPFNIEKANELLNSSEFSRFNNSGLRVNTKNKVLSIEILYGEALPQQILSFLNEQAKKAGIELTFRYLEKGALEKVSNGEFQIYFGHLGQQQVPNHYFNFHSQFAKVPGLNNIVGLENPELDTLLEEYQSWSGKFEALSELNKQIEKLVMEQFVFLPYYYSNTKSFLTWKWICFPGWVGHLQDPDFNRTLFSYAWFHQEIYDEVLNARKNNNRIPPAVFSFQR